MYHYSDEFKKLIMHPRRFRCLSEVSGVKTENFSFWENARSPISKLINKNGSILDIGCGSAFLLRCLQEWSDHEIVPYGIDHDPVSIREARKLFPAQAQNFMLVRLQEIKKPRDFSRSGLPCYYDFIYWNIWDRWFKEEKQVAAYCKVLLRAVNKEGKLILALYAGPDAKNREQLIENLKKQGFKFSGFLKTSAKEYFMWINKDEI